MRNCKNKSGFTLMEMLIVVAIIAILLAIAIPILNDSLERARKATDEANVKIAYNYLMDDFFAADTTGAAWVKLSTKVKKNDEPVYLTVTGPNNIFNNSNENAPAGTLEIDINNKYVKLASDSDGNITYQRFTNDEAENKIQSNERVIGRK